MSVLTRLMMAVLVLMVVPGFWLDQARGADEKAPKPKIEFFELSHDFGKASQDAALKHSFIFKNTGTGVLIIEKVKAG